MPVEGLPPPPELPYAQEGQARELVRIWWIEGQPSVVLTPVFNEPEWFGVILSDVVRQMAGAYERAGIADAASVRAKIEQGLTRALEDHTYAPGGQVRSGEITVEPNAGTQNGGAQ